MSRRQGTDTTNAISRIFDCFHDLGILVSHRQMRSTEEGLTRVRRSEEQDQAIQQDTNINTHPAWAGPQVNQRKGRLSHVARASHRSKLPTWLFTKRPRTLAYGRVRSWSRLGAPNFLAVSASRGISGPCARSRVRLSHAACGVVFFLDFGAFARPVRWLWC